MATKKHSLSWRGRSAIAAGLRLDGPVAPSNLRPLYDSVQIAEAGRQCVLLRDVVGNPLRSATYARSWLTATVISLAEAVYDNRNLPAGTLAPDLLAILADALEDAGCTDADILNHLRGPGPHVRGCWVLDLLLDKK